MMVCSANTVWHSYTTTCSGTSLTTDGRCATCREPASRYQPLREPDPVQMDDEPPAPKPWVKDRASIYLAPDRRMKTLPYRPTQQRARDGLDHQ